MTRPLITVGMVVRNGERTIDRAIESFLAQSMGDFRLVVHDNDSTDRTASIVEALSQRDDRVAMMRQPRDVGVVRNLIGAAEAATTPMFCWAACDDEREPTFLERLAGLLAAHPRAALACCAVRNIDPDGTLRDVRPETASLGSSLGSRASQRLRKYLRHMPGTPFYGLFRTAPLQASLDVLRELDARSGTGPPLLGLDMVFLARVARDFDIACAPEPLLRFRRGGISHDMGRYRSLPAFLSQAWRFNAALRIATRTNDPLLSRIRISAARKFAVWRWTSSPEMRAMCEHYLLNEFPVIRAIRTRLKCWTDPALRRLRNRVRSQPEVVRIVLFGAGKHTHRRLAELRRAVAGRATILAACDDDATRHTLPAGLRVVCADQLASLQPDVLLVSSDTYESSLFRRASAVAPPGTRLWCLYDLALEIAAGTSAADSSVSSTAATNADISASESPFVAVR